MVKLMSSLAIDDARDGICGFLGCVLWAVGCGLWDEGCGCGCAGDEDGGTGHKFCRLHTG